MELLERMDNKLSFILSVLVDKTKDIKQLDDILEVDKETLSDEKLMLFSEAERLFENCQDMELVCTASKILNNTLISKNYFDEQELEQIVEDNKYNEDDIIIIENKKDDVIEYLHKHFSDMTECSFSELKNELNEVLSE